MLKKTKAFTLVEILIAMALVGILAAVMSPNLSKVLPDKKKALFIKAYTNTEIAVYNMLNDPEMYLNKYDPETGAFTRFGLCNWDAPRGILAENGNAKSGKDKFAYYFAQELGGGYTEGTEGTEDSDGTLASIKTNDGLTFEIDAQNQNSTTKDAVAAIITITLEDDELGQIKVLNDGAVKCNDEDADNACTTYMDDRYNFKKSQ